MNIAKTSQRRLIDKLYRGDFFSVSFRRSAVCVRTLQNSWSILLSNIHHKIISEFSEWVVMIVNDDGKPNRGSRFKLLSGRLLNSNRILRMFLFLLSGTGKAPRTDSRMQLVVIKTDCCREALGIDFG